MGLEAFQARKLAFALGLKSGQINEAVRLMTGLYKAFAETDSSLMEINPFITCTDGRLFALDTGTISTLGWERETAVLQTWNRSPNGV